VLPESVPERAPQNPSPHPDRRACPQGEGEKIDDLHCPLCGYSLHGLPEPRCPECGYQFEWADLIEQQKRRESWFVEHAGTWRSFCRTWWRSLRTKRFWKEVQPAWAIDPFRLGGFLGINLLLTATLFAVLILGLPSAINGGLGLLDRFAPSRPPKPVTAMVSTANGQLVPYTYTPTPMTWAYQYGLLQIYFEENVGPTLVSAIVLAMTTPAFWLLLRQSAKRFHVRPAQFARVVIYLLTPLSLMVIGLVATGLQMAARQSIWLDYGSPSVYHTQIFIGAMFFLLMGTRVHAAARHYLRLPHAGWIALTYLLISTLVWACVLLQLYPLM